MPSTNWKLTFERCFGRDKINWIREMEYQNIKLFFKMLVSDCFINIQLMTDISLMHYYIRLISEKNQLWEKPYNFYHLK